MFLSLSLNFEPLKFEATSTKTMKLVNHEIEYMGYHQGISLIQIWGGVVYHQDIALLHMHKTCIGNYAKYYYSALYGDNGLQNFEPKYHNIS